MKNMESELEELGQRAAMLELYASERDAPFWMRERDALIAEQLRERQYLLLAGMRKCATDGCESMVGGDKFCLRCEEEIHAHRCAALYSSLRRIAPEPSRAVVWTALTIACVVFWVLCIWGCIDLIERIP